MSATPTIEAAEESQEQILDSREAPSTVRRRQRFGRPQIALLVGVLVLIFIPNAFGENRNFAFFVGQYALIYAMIGLSVTVVTGFSGLISIMPYSFAGIGAVVTSMAMALWGWPFWLALPFGVLATLPVSILVGVASVRLKALYLAIATLTFSNALGQTFFDKWQAVTGGRSGWHVDRPTLGPISFQSDQAFYLLCLVTILLLLWMVEGLRTSRTGRAMLAVRDNELEAQALGINPYKTKLVAFVLSGMLAGVGGGFLAPFLGSVTPSEFQSPTVELTSILLVTLVVIGGIDRAWGAFFGALSLVVTSQVFGAAEFFFRFIGVYTAVGLIVFLLRVPGGLVQLYRVQTELIKRRPALGITINVIGVSLNVGLAYLFIRLS